MVLSVSDFKDRVGSRINQVTPNGVFSSAGFIRGLEIVRWLNDGLSELVEKVSRYTSDFFEQKATADLVEDKQLYELYSEAFEDRFLITDVRIDYDGSGRFSVATQVANRTLTGEKLGGRTWSPLYSYVTKHVEEQDKNFLHLFIDPKPTQNVTEGLEVYYTEYYPLVEANEDEFELPTRKMYEWLERYVALQAFDKMENSNMIARTEQKLKEVEYEMMKNFSPRARGGRNKSLPSPQSSFYYAKSRGMV